MDYSRDLMETSFGAEASEDPSTASYLTAETEDATQRAASIDGSEMETASNVQRDAVAPNGAQMAQQVEDSIPLPSESNVLATMDGELPAAPDPSETSEAPRLTDSAEETAASEVTELLVEAAGLPIEAAELPVEAAELPVEAAELPVEAAELPVEAAEASPPMPEIDAEALEIEATPPETDAAPLASALGQPGNRAEASKSIRESNRPLAAAPDPASETLSEPAAATVQPALETDSEPLAAAPEPAETTASIDADSEAIAAESAATAVDESPKAKDGEPAAPQPIAMERVEAIEREVEGSQNKVYVLGKVKKAIGQATQTSNEEALTRLQAVEAGIFEQIEQRKAAKEQIIEQAEALSTSSEWRATGDKLKALFEEWRVIGAAGRQLDDDLWAKFIAARETFNKRRAAYFEERQQVWSDNRAKKEALCAEAEALATSEEWKATADKIRDLQAKWKEAGSAGRDNDELLWGRFNAAKQIFFDRRTEVWAANQAQKEALIAEAEALKDSTDWRLAGDAMKAMQQRWKEIGSAGKAQEDDLWNRFRAATQTFFERRSVAFTDRRNEERDNLQKKQELTARAESLSYSGDAIAASREAKELQAEWKATGPVPREQSDALWARFREACDRIFATASGERDRQQNEWQIRLREALTRKREQLHTLRESIEHDEENLNRWRESLSTLRPGGKSAEIEASLDTKILSVADRIREKRVRVEDLRTSIQDMEAKLRE